MRIVSIHLKNFMRYTDQQIDFAPGFNAFVGQSDSGKSSVLRALIWVWFNRPSGMEMCREGTDETIVTLTTDTGVTVSRVRSKKRNAYILDGQAYDAVKTDVPLEVQTALGIHMATLGPRVDEMLNVSRQMDAPFMLGSSGGDAAKVLGNLCGITTLDAALAGLRPDLTSIKRELDAVDKLEKAYKVALPEFAQLAAEEKLLDEIRDHITHAQQISARVEKLQEIKSKIERYKETVGGIDDRIRSLRETLAAEDLVKQADHVVDRINQLGVTEAHMKLVSSLYKAADETIAKTKLKIQTLQNHYDQVLSDAGSCPVCGNDTHEKSMVH